MRKISIALCAVLAVGAAPSQAATMTQYANSELNLINQLDPAFGTLNSVTISANYDRTYYFRNGDFLSANPVIDAVGSANTNGIATVDFTGPYQSRRENPELIAIEFTAMAAEQSSANLAQYVGTKTAGLFENYFDASFTINGVPIETVGSPFPAQPTSRYAVTYDYTPVAAALPEPSTWALMLLGFGGIGVAMRRRRASASRHHVLPLIAG